MRVTVISKLKRPIRTARIKAAAALTLRHAAPRRAGELCLVLTGDQTMKRLNRTFRGKDKPTDVLAFGAGNDNGSSSVSGDVIISVQTARRQARSYGATLEEELLRLAIHGVLHLCGYDHRRPAEAARMHGLTARLLARSLAL